MTVVTIADAQAGLGSALDEIFVPHAGVENVIARERACVEGCRGNLECIQEVL